MASRLVITQLTWLMMAMSTATAADSAPLLFEMNDEDPRLVAIYWNQNFRLKKVKEISSREVRYQNVTAGPTGPLQETYDPWQPLLIDEEDARKVSRFVLLRHELCREKDFRVSWYDQQDQIHDAETVRLGPSPNPWRHSFNIQLHNLHYDSANDTVKGKLTYEPKVADVDQSLVYLTIKSDQCAYVFTGWVLQPSVDSQTGYFILPFDYLKHGCRLKVQLNRKEADADNGCMQLYRTDYEHSKELNIRCEQVDGLQCPIRRAPVSSASCHLDCQPTIESEGMKGNKANGYKPFVRVKWYFTTGNRQPVKNYIIQTAEVDYAWNNNPVAMFNVTTKKLDRTVDSIDLPLFSKIANSFYIVQLCALYSDCPEHLDWNNVPRQSVSVTQILDENNLLNAETEPPSVQTTQAPTQGQRHTEAAPTTTNAIGADSAMTEDRQHGSMPRPIFKAENPSSAATLLKIPRPIISVASTVTLLFFQLRLR